MGATVESAVEALGLSEPYKRLKLRPTDTTPLPTIPSKRNTTKATKKTDDTTIENRILPATRTYVDRIIRLTRRSQNGLKDDLETISSRWIDDVEDTLITHLTEYARKTGLKLEQVLTAWAELHPEHPIAVDIQSYTTADWQKLYDWTTLPDNVKTAYETHLQEIAHTTSKTITDKTLEILNRADTEQWDAHRLHDELDRLGNDHAELIARCETVQSQRLGSLYSARNISETLGIKLQKVWRTTGDGNTCDFCRYMEGTTMPLDSAYMAKDAAITIGDHSYTNSFETMSTPNGHPRCRCYEDYEVVEG